ncbi:MAG TPA: hypothetical protein VJU82_04385 [Acidobacteriaceae bacterium]|nr:hypothetical protein [Acidobacteriaceae bacterium]
MMERADDAQSMALRAFLLLCALQENWPGKLVLIRRLDDEGRAVSVASSIAGAACLSLDARADACRATLRAGACDFLVNSTDEALRILKNEIRKRKPVSVAVAMPESAALEELTGRGVRPEAYILTSAVTPDATESRFAGLGTRIISIATAGDTSQPHKLVQDYADTRNLVPHEFRCSTPQQLRELDRRIETLIPEGDPRHRWATLAPRYFYRDPLHRRATYLAPGELASLA